MHFYELLPQTMAFIKKTRGKYEQGLGEKKGTLVQGWRECKSVQPLYKAVWKFLKK